VSFVFSQSLGVNLFGSGRDDAIELGTGGGVRVGERKYAGGVRADGIARQVRPLVGVRRKVGGDLHVVGVIRQARIG